jgi:23S rRNA pseudouridine2604 synthase
MHYPIRINKYIREKGIASRKEADKLVVAGLVLINGKTAKVGEMVVESDRVEVRGDRVGKKHEYFAYYKPRGLATQGPEGGESVITLWAKKGLFPVGRLDKESEGLLILTNDGRVSTSVLGPASGFEKEYLVKVNEPLRTGVEAIFEKGMRTETFGNLLPAKARVLDDHAISVILREGKRHQIRVMLGELGYTVSELKRVRVGGIKLSSLRPGQVRELGEKEVGSLLA